MILKLETYRENLDLPSRYLADALATADVDITSIDPYTGEPLEPDEHEDKDEDEETEEEQTEIEGGGDGPASVGEAERAFARVFVAAAQRRLSPLERLTGFEKSANRKVISFALLVLGRLRSDEALEHGPQLVAVDPLLARQYAGYLGSLEAEGTATSERVAAVLARFDGHAPYWTQAWLASALMQRSTELTETLKAWLREFLVGPAPAVLRTQAALVLAIHGDLAPRQIADLFDDLPLVARPDLAAALGASGTPATGTSQSVITGDRLLQWAFEYGSAGGLV